MKCNRSAQKCNGGTKQKCNWGHANAMSGNRSVTGAWLNGLLKFKSCKPWLHCTRMYSWAWEGIYKINDQPVCEQVTSSRVCLAMEKQRVIVCMLFVLLCFVFHGTAPIPNV